MAEINKVNNYKTVYRGGTAEIVEKKSRFIAHSAHVESEEEALAFIEQIKKQYWDARHNCHAFSVGVTNETARCSDDGEPSGTAGRPMLDVILGEDIYNVAVVVTRYFGGVLLGTGGLVRAYSGAVQEGLRASTVIEKHHGISMAVSADYTMVGKLQYIAAENGLPILDTEYTDRVMMHLLIPADQVDEEKWDNAIVYDDALLEPLSIQRNFDWKIPGNNFARSIGFIKKAGSTIVVSCYVYDDRYHHVGIRRPDGSMLYVNGMHQVTKTFNCETTGTYYVYVENMRSKQIRAAGYFIR